MKSLKPGNSARVRPVCADAIADEAWAPSFGATCQTNHRFGSAKGPMQQSAIHFPGCSFTSTLPGQSIETRVLSGTGRGGGGSYGTEPSAPSGPTCSSESSSTVNLSWSTASAPVVCFSTGHALYRGAINRTAPAAIANPIQLYTRQPSDADRKNNPVSLGSKHDHEIDRDGGLCMEAIGPWAHGVRTRRWSCTSGEVNQEFKLTQESQRT